MSTCREDRFLPFNFLRKKSKLRAIFGQEPDLYEFVQEGIDSGCITIPQGEEGETITVSNALLRTADNITFGGALIQNTSVTGAHNFTVAIVGTSKEVNLSAEGLGSTLSLSSYGGININTTNSSGDIVIFSAGAASFSGNSSTTINSAGQTTVGGNQVVIGTTNITGGKVIIAPNTNLNITNLPIYVGNAEAISDGLDPGDVYRTAAGDLKITYTP